MDAPVSHTVVFICAGVSAVLPPMASCLRAGQLCWYINVHPVLVRALNKQREAKDEAESDEGAFVGSALRQHDSPEVT